MPSTDRPGPEQLLALRRRHLGRGLSLSYREPLTIVRGSGAYLYDERGRAYLDCVNNVCHVGHADPRVVEAAATQMRELNTNTRYLHPNLSRYVRELAARFPDPLSVVYLVCTGSEATDLALRLARNHTGAREVVVLESAYHGNTRAAIEVSPYKFDGPGGGGRPETTRVAPLPCGYRGRHRDPAAEVERIVEALRDDGGGPAAFLCESMLGVAGQIVLPEGYLARAYAATRKAGGVCIADEVQVGFGRCGSDLWSFQMQGVVPEIVILGKPIGNGHPIGAVITTPEISEAFDNGMEYFNTFGGNPVSCAAGLAVLEVIEEQGLQAHAGRVGEELLERLVELKLRHRLIGDVRGRGLFLGIDLVSDRETLEPAPEAAHQLVEAMKERGILLSVDGMLHNVIKFKPPMVFAREDGERLVQNLDEALTRIEENGE